MFHRTFKAMVVFWAMLGCASTLAQFTPVDCSKGVEKLKVQQEELKKTSDNIQFCQPQREYGEHVAARRSVCRSTFITAQDKLEKLQSQYETACQSLNTVGNKAAAGCSAQGTKACFREQAQQLRRAANEFEKISAEIDKAIDELKKKKQENVKQVEQFADDIKKHREDTMKIAEEYSAIEDPHHPSHSTTQPEEARSVVQKIKGNDITARGNTSTVSPSTPINDHALAAGSAQDTIKALQQTRSEISSTTAALRQQAAQLDKFEADTGRISSPSTADKNQPRNATGSSQIPQMPMMPQGQGGENGGANSGIAGASSVPTKDLAAATNKSSTGGPAAPSAALAASAKSKGKSAKTDGDFDNSTSRFSDLFTSDGARPRGKAVKRGIASVSAASRMGAGSGTATKSEGATPEELLGTNSSLNAAGGSGDLGIASTQTAEMMSDLERDFGLGEANRAAFDGASSGATDLFDESADPIQAENLGDPETSLFERVNSYHKRCQQKGCVVQTVRLWKGF